MDDFISTLNPKQMRLFQEWAMSQKARGEPKDRRTTTSSSTITVSEPPAFQENPRKQRTVQDFHVPQPTKAQPAKQKPGKLQEQESSEDLYSGDDGTDEEIVFSDEDNTTINEAQVADLFGVADRAPVWRQMGFTSYKDKAQREEYLKLRRIARCALSKSPHPFKVSMCWSSVKSKPTRILLIKKVQDALKAAGKNYVDSVILAIILSLTHNRRRNRNRARNYLITQNGGHVKKGRPITHGKYVGQKKTPSPKTVPQLPLFLSTHALPLAKRTKVTSKQKETVAPAQKAKGRGPTIRESSQATSRISSPPVPVALSRNWMKDEIIEAFEARYRLEDSEEEEYKEEYQNEEEFQNEEECQSEEEYHNVAEGGHWVHVPDNPPPKPARVPVLKTNVTIAASEKAPQVANTGRYIKIADRYTAKRDGLGATFSKAWSYERFRKERDQEEGGRQAVRRGPVESAKARSLWKQDSVPTDAMSITETSVVDQGLATPKQDGTGNVEHFGTQCPPQSFVPNMREYSKGARRRYYKSEREGTPPPAQVTATQFANHTKILVPGPEFPHPKVALNSQTRSLRAVCRRNVQKRVLPAALTEKHQITHTGFGDEDVFESEDTKATTAPMKPRRIAYTLAERIAVTNAEPIANRTESGLSSVSFSQSAVQYQRVLYQVPTGAPSQTAPNKPSSTGNLRPVPMNTRRANITRSETQFVEEMKAPLNAPKDGAVVQEPATVARAVRRISERIKARALAQVANPAEIRKRKQEENEEKGNRRKAIKGN